jgi:GTP-binding protein
MSSSEHFIDEARISVQAGRGGDGCMSFRREKFVPRGGPNGGDGGRGGDVVLVADEGLRTLLEQRYRAVYQAARGGHGGSSDRSGPNGEDVVIRVPVGTLVRDVEQPDPPLADLVEHGQRFLAARGGRGGRGNTRFATATRQAPDFAEDGRAGGSRELVLSLKLLADVGLVGLPNAGKSTLLGQVSRARPRVAAYPVTTLVPSLGVVEVDETRFVMADIPGLIEGASQGAGLGDRFLRHVERTRVLVHLLDVAAALVEGRDLVEDYDTLRTELRRYDPSLLERRELVALNKVDAAHDRAVLDEIEAKLATRGRSLHRISGATGEGVPALLRDVAAALAEAKAETEAGS